MSDGEHHHDLHRSICVVAGVYNSMHGCLVHVHSAATYTSRDGYIQQAYWQATCIQQGWHISHIHCASIYQRSVDDGTHHYTIDDPCMSHTAQEDERHHCIIRHDGVTLGIRVLPM